MARSKSQLDALCRKFRLAVRAGESPTINEYLKLVPSEERENLLAQLLPIQIENSLDSALDIDPESFAEFGEEAVSVATRAVTKVKPADATQDFVEKTTAAPGDKSANTVAGAALSGHDSSHGYEVDPEQIGPYTLLRPIGRGGMGAVWEAKQEAPVKRHVAIKLIRNDIGTKDALARFEMERNAISKMDHPNIARILDAGEAEDGRPFFVMELVKGKTIDRYCDSKKLTIRERIELMVPVCKAIQHAHQKGIIHRDLKPSNVLVVEIDGVMTPKVIDFGVAKALQKRKPFETDKAAITNFGQVVGTLQYMSPEQSTGRDVDTRTDVYGLGALLYRLLTGSLPVSDLAVQTESIVAFADHLRNYDAPKLSSRFRDTSSLVGDVCKARQTTPERLRQELRGDLDCVVGKAVERNQKQRYQTAQELAVDLERYLRDDEVQARPPSAVYRLQKFVRRNRLAVGSVVAIVTLLISGILGTSLALFEARRAENLAKENEAKAQRETENALREQAAKERFQRLQETQLEALRLKSAWSNWQLGNVGSAWEQLRASDSEPAWEGRYLQSEFSGMHQIFYGHTSQVLAVAYAPAQKLIATAGTDQTIRIWDGTTFKQVLVREVGAAITDLKFNSAGNGLYAADLSNQVSYVPLAQDEPIARTQRYIGDINSVCPFVLPILPSEEGRQEQGTEWIAISQSDKDNQKVGIQWSSESVGEPLVRILDGETFEEVQTFDEHDGTVHFIVASQDGRLASGDAKGRLIVWAWNGEEFQESARFEFKVKLHDAAFLPQANEILLACDDGTVRRIGLDAEDTSPKLEQLYVGHKNTVTAVALSPDGKKIAAASEDKTARVWELDGKLVLECRGHFNGLNDIVFIKDGNQIVTGADDATAAVWSAVKNPSTHSIKAFESLAWSADFSADGSRLVAVSEDGSVQLRSARSLSLIKRVKTDCEQLCTAFSPNANILAHAGVDGVVTIRDGSDLEELKAIAGHDSYVWDLAFSHDGKSLATAGSDNLARIWNTDTWELEVEFAGHSAEVASVCFSSDDRWLATGGDDQTVRIWERSTGEQIHAFEGHSNIIWKVAISPDDSRVVSSGYDGEIRIWDVDKRELIHSIQAHQNQVAGLAISRDNRRIVTASDDRTMRVWDLESGLEIFDMSDPGDTHIVHASFSPDGRQLVSGDSKGWLTLRTALGPGQLARRVLPQQALALGIQGERTALAPDSTEEQLQDLVARAEEVCRYFPGFQVLIVRGIAEYRLGQYEAATTSLTKAARLEPIEYGDPDLMPYIEAYLCLSYAELERWAEAEEQAEKFQLKRSAPAMQYDPHVQKLEERINAALEGRTAEAPQE